MPLPGGSRKDRYTFSYEAGAANSEERPLRSRFAFVIEVAIDVPAPPVWFVRALIDDSRDNRSDLGTQRFTVARPEAACG